MPIDVRDFQREVIDASFQKPVLVDFWAPWCGPCRMLGPALEALEREAGGKWILAKLNTDENPQIAAQYGIRGIPNVKLFYQGRPIAEFTGALPKFQIEQWLKQHLPGSSAQQLEVIRSLVKSGNVWEALMQLKELMAKDPDNDDARALYVHLTALDNLDEAVEQLKNITEGSPHYELAEAVRALHQLMHVSEAEIGGSPAAPHITAAQQALAEKNYDATLAHLIDAVIADKKCCDELPRRATIGLFYLLGAHHPLTRKYRRRFDMALY